MSKRRFVGLDVHKDTIVMAVAEEGPSEADVSRLRVRDEAGIDGVVVVPSQVSQ